MEQVLKEIISYKPIKYKRVFNDLDIKPVKQYNHSKYRVAYVFACKDRYSLLKTCLDSFKDSNPLKGTLFVLNDCSLDLRVDELFRNFHIDGIEIEYVKLPFVHMKLKGVRTAMLYNKLNQMVFNSNEVFDYVALLDSDLLFKGGWIQKEISIYEEVGKKYKISAVTGFAYQDVGDSKIYRCKCGQYRLNAKISGQWLMSFEFLQKSFGIFDETAGSADISKFEDLAEQGYIGVKVSPSVIQHAGAYSSSLRAKPGAFVEDFI